MALAFADSDHHLDSDLLAVVSNSVRVVTASELEAGNHILLHNVVVQVLHISKTDDRAYLTLADTDMLIEHVIWSSDLKIDLLEE